MKHFIRKIHLWLSVPFGLIITLVCFSGAMLVFEKEVTQLFNGGLYTVEKAGGRPLPVGVLVDKVAQTLPEGMRVTGVTVSSDTEKAYSVSISKPHRAAVIVNQYTGEVKGRQERNAFFAAMFSLHRWLMDNGRPEGRPVYGKIIVGISTIMFVIALVSGIIIWWPKTRRALRNSLKLTLRNGRFRLWHSLHVAGGMYAVLLLLVMSLTGLTWSFSWYRTAFYAAFGVEVSAKGAAHGGKAAGNGRKAGRNVDDGKRTATMNTAVWQQVYDRLHAGNPDARSITISDGTATVSSAAFGNTRAADRYTFDVRTGRITSVTKYADAARQSKLRGLIYSVHVGSFGGLLTRLMWFAAALMGATLPLTGYYLWLRRLSNGARRKAACTA
jgi:uncharacterized iron-regulated membrane protein